MENILWFKTHFRSSQSLLAFSRLVTNSLSLRSLSSSMVSILQTDTENAQMKHPRTARAENRANKHFKNVRFLAEDFPGYFQANLAIVTSDYAKYFKTFCELNDAACPLVFTSKPGQIDAPLLAKDSDIRTDCGAYRVYKDGALDGHAPDLLQYDWNKMVTFYLGCSYSFESDLVSKGIRLRHLEERKSVPMYISKLKCQSAGPFSTNMVVSMRPIPKSLLNAMLECCRSCDLCHGAPIHIGDGKEIGIESCDQVSFGDPTVIEEDDVQVYWGCGVTAASALRQANLSIAFTHGIGSMFLGDVKMNDKSVFQQPVYPPARVICLNEKNQCYSVLSDDAINTVEILTKSVSQDPADIDINRGNSDFLKASLSISQSCKDICIVLGSRFENGKFRMDQEELVGAIIIAKSLQRINCSVTFVISSQLSEFYENVVNHCHKEGVLTQKVAILTPSETPSDRGTDIHRFSHKLVLRNCNTSVSSGDIAAETNVVQNESDNAYQHDAAITIAVDFVDGGHSVENGSFQPEEFCNKELARRAKLSADYHVMCNSPNSFAYAMVCTLYTVVNCRVHDRYRRRGTGLPLHFSFDDFAISEAQIKEVKEFMRSIEAKHSIPGTVTGCTDDLFISQRESLRNILEIQ